MICICCSGTGGHIYPAIAYAQKYKNKKPFIIAEADRLALSIVPKYNIHFIGLKIKQKNIFSWLINIFVVCQILQKKNVKEIISTGGYCSFPVVIAGFLKRIPVTIHEQNVIPGRANKFLAMFAQSIHISFDRSKSHFKHKNIVFTGNPLRLSYPKDLTCEKIISLNWTQKKRCIVFGGSQGAKFLNDFIFKNQTFFKKHNIGLIHICGSKTDSSLFENKNVINDDQEKPLITMVKYIENMDLLYKWATHVISRAGATTIAELLHYNKKALLIPYPYAKDNHQEANANEILKNNHVQKIAQKNLTITVLEKFLMGPTK